MSDPESDLVRELRAIAGVEKGDSFDVRVHGIVIAVNYSGGSSSSLRLSLRYDIFARAAIGYRSAQLASVRPMRIVIRPERDSDVLAKESGIDVEHQTGDVEFDRKVYVDTMTKNEVLRHVLGPDVRRAVLDLFTHEFVEIEIDDRDGNVSASISSFASLAQKPSPGAAVADAFARLVKGLPPVSKVEGEHAPHPLDRTSTILAAIAVPSFFGSFPLYFLVIASGRCPDDMAFTPFMTDCLGSGIIGALAGVVAGIIVAAAARVYARRFGGRSDSSRFIGQFVGFAFFLTMTWIGIATAAIVRFGLR